jgi:hypothetical protein
MDDTLKRKIFPLYPLLLSVYPPLALLSANLGQVAFLAVVRSLLVSLLFGALVYGLLRLALKSWQRAAPLAAFLLVLFFTYGHIYGVLESLQVGNVAIGRHRYLVPVWIALGLAGSWLLLRRKSYPRSLHVILTAICAGLVVLVVGQTVYAQARSSLRIRQRSVQSASQAGLQNTSATLPDVYWIILDGYGRSDALLEDYGFDNQPFLNELRGMGFVIPDCTGSNYIFTALSVSSTLHMDYIENYTPFVAEGDTTADWITYHDYLVHNPVRDQMEARGYTFVTFETGYDWADISDSDYFIVGNDNPLGKTGGAAEISDFEELYIRTTALRPLEEMGQTLRKRLAPEVLTKYERRYITVNFMLDQLKRVPEIEGRKFVMAHIMAPHDPFVFDAQGNYVEIMDPLDGYANQVQYINGRMLEIVRTILAESDTPPVIVIQGDHGWSSHNRNKNLNAYHLPGAGADKIYPTITPVNTFRVILDTYFGGHYGLIEDKQLYSPPGPIYQFRLVQPSCVNMP